MFLTTSFYVCWDIFMQFIISEKFTCMSGLNKCRCIPFQGIVNKCDGQTDKYRWLENNIPIGFIK